jgi:hypothetical protein
VLPMQCRMFRRNSFMTPAPPMTLPDARSDGVRAAFDGRRETHAPISMYIHIV